MLLVVSIANKNYPPLQEVFIKKVKDKFDLKMEQKGFLIVPEITNDFCNV